MESNVAVQGQKRKKGDVCAYFVVGCFESLTVPGAQLVPVQPFANDAGHSDNIGNVVQKDMIVLNKGQRMESGLQTAQPINGRGLALLAYLHEEKRLLQQIQHSVYVCMCMCVCVRVVTPPRPVPVAL